jgi:hypothetical protein
VIAPQSATLKRPTKRTLRKTQSSSLKHTKAPSSAPSCGKPRHVRAVAAGRTSDEHPPTRVKTRPRPPPPAISPRPPRPSPLTRYFRYLPPPAE